MPYQTTTSTSTSSSQAPTTLSRFRDRLSTLSPLDKLVRSTAAQAQVAPSPTLSYYHQHVPPTPATTALSASGFEPTGRYGERAGRWGGKGEEGERIPPVPPFPFGSDHGPVRTDSTIFFSGPGSPAGSPQSITSTPSRRKSKPAPLVLTPPMVRVPGVAKPGEGINIFTTVPSPTFSSSPSPSDALSFRTRSRKATEPPPTLSTRQASLPLSLKRTRQNPPPLSRVGTDRSESEYATVEPGYVLPAWMHGTDTSINKQARMLDFLRIGGGGGIRSAGAPCSNYTGEGEAEEEEDEDEEDVFTDGGDLGLRHKPSLGRSSGGKTPNGDVLHNVLLTPTYQPSIASSGLGGVRGEQGRRRLINPLAKTPTGSSGAPPGSGSDKRGRRTTVLDRAANLLANKRLNFVESRTTSHEDSDQTGGTVGKNKYAYAREKESSSAKRSDAMEMGTLDRSVTGLGYGGGYAYKGGKGRDVDGESEAGGWKLTKRFRGGSKREGKKFKQVHIVMIISAIVVGLLIISICTALLTKKGGSTSSPSTNTSSDGFSSTSSHSVTATSTSPSPTSTAFTIDSCLNLFALSAPTAPGSYPCDTCVPILRGAKNDFLGGSGSNATGVGATLQFCALQTIFAATAEAGGAVSIAVSAPASASPTKRRRSVPFNARDGNATSGLSGWMANASPCTSWQGISCDNQGRVTGLTMAYPAVPATVSASFANLVALTTLKLVGNSVIPNGPFPNEILSLPSLTSLDIESTALTGSLSADAFDVASKLQTLVLVSNSKLGTQLPSLYGASAIQTITITGQALTAIPGDLSTSTLSYLDLSYNSLGGVVPDTSGYSALTTLFFEGNSFTTLPSAFAPNLASLSLQGNPALTGSLPSSLCSSTVLSSCTLSNTLLETANEINKTAISFASATTMVGSSTVAAYAAVTSVSTSTAQCGVCTF